MTNNLKSTMLLVALVGLAMLGWVWLLLADSGVDQDRDGGDVKEHEQIIKLIAIPNGAAPEIAFDMVRQFIHRHSRHQEDAEFRRIMNDEKLITGWLIAHATGQTSEPVHLECSSRSKLMSKVLRKLGYRTRIVYIFNTDADEGEKLGSHTFIDVLNPSTGKWESHDPDYDFAWKAVATGDRASVFEMPEDLSQIAPCDKNRCGWDLVSDEGLRADLIRNRIDIVSVIYKWKPNQSVTRLTSRANLDRAFTFLDRRGTFCEIMARLCVTIERASVGSN